jgi:hypothetical protein
MFALGRQQVIAGPGPDLQIPPTGPKPDALCHTGLKPTIEGLPPEAIQDRDPSIRVLLGVDMLETMHV